MVGLHDPVYREREWGHASRRGPAFGSRSGPHGAAIAGGEAPAVVAGLDVFPRNPNGKVMTALLGSSA